MPEGRTFKFAVQPAGGAKRRRLYHVRMRHDLMEILVCPMCKGDLTLTVDKEDGAEIVEGKLVCAKCSETYPIEDGIPNLLPPDLRD